MPIATMKEIPRVTISGRGSVTVSYTHLVVIVPKYLQPRCLESVGLSPAEKSGSQLKIVVGRSFHNANRGNTVVGQTVAIAGRSTRRSVIGPDRGVEGNGRGG